MYFRKGLSSSMTWRHGETFNQAPLCPLYPSTELNQQNVIAEFGQKTLKNNRKIIISLKNVISTIHCYISKCSGTLSGRLATSLHLIQVFYKLPEFFHVMAVKLAHDLRPCHMHSETNGLFRRYKLFGLSNHAKY